MRAGEGTYGVHGIPQRLYHVLDLVAVLSRNQEEPSKADDFLQFRTDCVQEMTRVPIG